MMLTNSTSLACTRLQCPSLTCRRAAWSSMIVSTYEPKIMLTNSPTLACTRLQCPSLTCRRAAWSSARCTPPGVWPSLARERRAGGSRPPRRSIRRRTGSRRAPPA
eukprot:1729907-Pyramimonas_sp.AAC.1